MKTKITNDQLNSQLNRQLWSRLGGQLEGQLWSRLGGQLDDRLWGQLRVIKKDNK